MQPTPCRYWETSLLVVDATAELADLAYDLYVEVLDDLRALEIVGLEVVDTFERLSKCTGGFEAEALSLALCDYLASTPRRSREQFCRFIVSR